MEQQHHLQYNLFKVPQVSLSSKKVKFVIGLIDASGSMGSYWPAMVKFWNQSIAPSASCVITFSHVAKLSEDTFLSEDLKKHGGGMTNILSAFEAMQHRIVQYPEEASFTIIFISDGEDTANGEEKLRQKLKQLRGGQGRDITLICLGIQGGFPTKLAMDIRQMYHTGDEKIPALYLIEYASEKAFFNKFQSMSHCFKISNSVRCLNAKGLIKEYPWENEEVVPEIKEGLWIMADRSVKTLDLIYNQSVQKSFPVLPIENCDLQDFVDCFRGWVQKIQLLSMDNNKINETSQIAATAVKLIIQYTNLYESHHKIYIIKQRPLGIKQSFKERAASLAVKNVGSRIKWYIDELKIISRGFGIGQLGQYEAAKRLGIGTITGKYHQKALALKGITVKDFQLIKKQFTQTFAKTKLSEKPSNQQVSIFTLQNQKEVFQQPDFLEGLKLCGNQYDLIQSFPVVGYSLKVKRYDGSLINPWKVRVLQLAKTHNSIDSVYLANNSNKYQLSVGEGKVEEINAILPLFGEQDVEMADLLNTKLFKLAVSFMVVQNIDTFHEQAYLALLASTFVFLIKEPDSEWKKNLLKLIHNSLKVTYWQTKEFREFIERSIENPHVLFNSKEKEDHTDITKVMLLVYFIGRQKLVSPQKLDHLVDLVMVHYVEKTYVENEFKLSRVANIQIKVKEDEGLLKQGKMQTEKEAVEKNIIRNYEHLKKVVDQQVSSMIDNDKIDIEFSEKIFTHDDEERRVTYQHIKAFYQKSKKQKLNPIDFIYYFGHALKGKSEQVYRTPVSKDINDVKAQVFKKIDIKALGPNQGKKIKELKKMTEDKIVEKFQRAHFGIMPLTVGKFKDLCQTHHINPKLLNLNETSGMISNACMSPNCVFYLQPMKPAQFVDHMRLWRKTMPTRFHFTVANMVKQKKSVEEIFNYLIKSGQVDLKKHKKTKEEVLQYIAIIGKSLEQ